VATITVAAPGGRSYVSVMSGALADPGGVLRLLEEVGSGVGTGQSDTSYVPDGADVDPFGARAVVEERYTDDRPVQVRSAYDLAGADHGPVGGGSDLLADRGQDGQGRFPASGRGGHLHGLGWPQPILGVHLGTLEIPPYTGPGWRPPAAAVLGPAYVAKIQTRPVRNGEAKPAPRPVA
jgi:hypothetical protein